MRYVMLWLACAYYCTSTDSVPPLTSNLLNCSYVVHLAILPKHLSCLVIINASVNEG